MRTLGAEQADEEARLAEAERLQQEVGVWAGGWVDGRANDCASSSSVCFSLYFTYCVFSSGTF